MPTFPVYDGELPSCLNPLNLRHYGLLAYWIYFRPTALKYYLYQANPELYKNSGDISNFIRGLRTPTYRNLLFTALGLAFGLLILIALLIGLPGAAVQELQSPDISWQCPEYIVNVPSIEGIKEMCQRIDLPDQKSSLSYWLNWLSDTSLRIVQTCIGIAWFGMAFGVVAGAAAGVARGVASSVAFEVAFGVIIGVVIGVVRSVKFAEATGVIVGVAHSFEFGIAYGVAISVALGMALGVTGGVVFGVVIGISGAAFGVPFGAAFGVPFGAAISVGAFRLPIYIVQVIASISARNRQSNYPITWDELSVFSAPQTTKFLSHLLKTDEHRGLKILAQQMGNPFQRWSTQKSLYHHLHCQTSPFHFFYQSFNHPALASYAVAPRKASEWRDYVSSGQLLLAELAGFRIDIEGNTKSRRFFEHLVYTLTKRLRYLQTTPITLFAQLFYLLNYIWDEEKPINLTKYKANYQNLTAYPCGTEITQSFETIAHYLTYTTLETIPTAPNHLTWINPAETYLRPTVIAALKTLGNISIEIRTYTHSTSRVNKLAALARANDALQTLAQTHQTANPPENLLLRRIIHQWQTLITTASGSEGRATELTPIANPYVIGNPVSGDLFVGRDDIMRRFEELWNAPGQIPSIVLYGHRRMGKTSILRNLPGRFGRDRIIDFNMQRVGIINSTGELLHALATALYDELTPNQQQTLSEPLETDYLTQPTARFDRFLKKLAPLRNERFIVAIDEFEIIEELIKERKLEPQLLGYWRSLINTYPWFVMVFAGLHTLGEMTHDYWNPLFGNVTPIHVSFLTYADALELITNPSPDFNLDYSHEAIDLIYSLTNGQPYLVQLVCHNLITHFNRQRFEEKRDRPLIFSHQDVETVIAMPEFFRNGNAYFNGVWEQAKEAHGQTQITLLQALSPQPLTLDQLTQQIPLSLSEIQAALKTLIDHDVIQQRGDRHEYKVELMRRWVANLKL
jgi:AAA+ ATPase superfamily predicted ATPase